MGMLSERPDAIIPMDHPSSAEGATRPGRSDTDRKIGNRDRLIVTGVGVVDVSSILRHQQPRRDPVKRSLISKVAMGSAVAALALGTVACDDIEAGDDMDPGMEDGGDDLGGEEDAGDDL
jgi:hypothetical protein